MNKKGLSILLTMGEIIVVLVVAGMILYSATLTANSEKVKRVNLVNDINMFVNVFVSIPGNAVVTLPYDTSEYNLAMGPNSISIGDITDDIGITTEEKFILPKGYDAGGTSPQKRFSCLEKRNKLILLRPCEGNEIVFNLLGKPNEKKIFTKENLHFRYQTEWQWSLDSEKWNKLSVNEVDGNAPTDKAIEIINYLKENGVKYES
jgi:hypothetical protein